MTDKESHTDGVNRFYVENPAWIYGKKLVVMAADYDQLQARVVMLEEQLRYARIKAEEWERAARIQRERNSGRISLVKTSPKTDACGLPINPVNLGGGPYEP